MKKIDVLNETLTRVEKEMANIENTIINEAWITADMLTSDALYARLIEMLETASCIKEHLQVVLNEYRNLIVTDHNRP